ncbi:MAG: S8 family peptidase [Bacteroidia bacterium]|nr:S8 family peptidase [Bacteroidia bacterium]NNF31549.1 S8 family serine peptidase [Flavobacteriaceae bacterium]MBT8275624.1 S8 family peptidase [Bacteroidia bacterium]NNJ82379.1 S8 family serine peptidase [Flavobacteriaceae bacterium]NNK54128.1 S8 family serine peptidase [Flavobacteriaceae bacterium]
MEKFTFFSINRKSVSFWVLALACTFVFAQNNYTITFQDETIEMPENINTFEWSQMPDYAHLRDGYIGWVQFYETPTQTVQDQFAANGLDLISYIPHHTYLFRFPETTSVSFLQNNGVRSIVPVQGRFRLSENLKNGNIGDWAIEGDFYIVTLQFYPYVDAQYVINDLAAKQISVKEQYTGSNNIDLIIPNDCLESLVDQPYVKWVEVIGPPGETEAEVSKSLMRSSGLDTQTPSGLSYDGEGVGVLTRDQGPVFQHVDFAGRLTNVPPFNSGTHGIQVTGGFAGAGNIRPDARGSAAGATIFATGYNSTFLDNNTVTLINSGDVQITNSSYSDVCNGPYSSKSQTVDTQIHDIPTLQHVFSAGNSNGSNCGYGAGSQWGNITGGHKAAKNCVTVGATSALGNIAGFSSRGPAFDGRIKPDVAGHGASFLTTNPGNSYTVINGTSYSAPATAGVMAQLYQVYMEANGGSLPQSALIKAALLNCATDFGNPGPDFIYGWGIVNGLRSGQLIEDGNYLSDDISQGGTNTHTINVPSGTAQVRFMVYWSDEPATPGSNPALVNDLDLEVVDPSNNTLLPFLLDHTPDPNLLNLPAGNGADHLNNMEQVLIDAPAAGSYDIEISGFNVPIGPQEYFVVYDFIEENITVDYPNGGEKISAGGVVNVHWDAVNTTQGFTLEYSDDDGASWTTFANPGANFRSYSWNTAGLGIAGNGEMKVRVTSGSFSDESDESFSFADVPDNLEVVEVCETEATFEWDAVDGAEFYDLYLLGEKYMEIVGTSETNSITIPITDPDAELWMAIAARNETEGWEGRRSWALRYGGGILDCDLGFDDNALASNVILSPNPASDQVTISLIDASFNSFEVTVLNSLGQTLQTVSEDNGSSSTVLNVSNYRTGIYFVTIEVDGLSTTKKLVIR